MSSDNIHNRKPGSFIELPNVPTTILPYATPQGITEWVKKEEFDAVKRQRDLLNDTVKNVMQRLGVPMTGHAPDALVSDIIVRHVQAQIAKMNDFRISALSAEDAVTKLNEELTATKSERDTIASAFCLLSHTFPNLTFDPVQPHAFVTAIAGEVIKLRTEAAHQIDMACQASVCRQDIDPEPLIEALSSLCAKFDAAFAAMPPEHDALAKIGRGLVGDGAPALQPTTPHPFLAEMQKRINANAERGDWAKWWPSSLEIDYAIDNAHVALIMALQEGNREAVRKHSANLANYAHKAFEVWGFDTPADHITVEHLVRPKAAECGQCADKDSEFEAFERASIFHHRV